MPEDADVPTDEPEDTSLLLADHPVAIRVSAALWIIGGLLLVAMAFDSLASTVQVPDDAVWRWVVDRETRWLVSIAEVFNVVGSAWVLFPVMTAIGLYLLGKGRRTELMYWAGVMAVSQLLIGPLKVLYARPRPPMALVATTGDSFPSGHSLAGTAVAIGLVIVLFRAGPRRRNLEMTAALFGVFMGWSRIYLRAHWMSDALAGVALGAAVAIGLATFVHRVELRRGREEYPVQDPDL